MERVERRELDTCSEEWDAAVAGDPGLDPFCTRSAWQLSFHDAFRPERPLWLAREGESWVVLAQRGIGPARPVLEPLESMWGLASPLLGARAPELLARALDERPASVCLLGLPLDRARLSRLVDALAGRFPVLRIGRPATRCVASLEDGLDGWQGRRSHAFRRNLRAAIRRVSQAGIEFTHVDEVEPQALAPLYERVLDVERRSWKSAGGNGADSEPMRSFYRTMWPRLAERGELRVVLAERDGSTVGYLHGGLVGGHFRGLQFSFDDELRALGLGNVLQYQMLRSLCEGGARRYDLGTWSAYKSRWAEARQATCGLFVRGPGR